MKYIIRPLGPWLEPITEPRRGAHLFKATWDDTLGLLASELEKLGAIDAIFQIDVTEEELRRDGMLRANSRVNFPGVRISFDSIHGPLTYATDAYERTYHWAGRLESWQANIRAIALALEALRAVDRYGVTRRGEQYVGWQAIDSKPAVMTREQAAEFIAHWAAGEMTGLTGATLLANPAMLASAYRAAAKATHPDRTGDSDTFARINVARDLLTKEVVR